jgi:uncharacterized protein YwbE
LHVIGNATISSTANIGQISLSGTRIITTNTGNTTMSWRSYGYSTGGNTGHIIGSSSLTSYTNSSGDTVNLSIDNTVNQTGTAGHTDVLINRTETAVGSGNQYLLDAQVGGTSYFKIGNDGKFGRMNNQYSAWTSSQNTIEMGGYGLRIYAYNQEIAGCYGPTNKFHVGKYTGGNYTFLKSEITGTLALEHGTTATGLHLYNTYTDASNYERAFLDWSSGVFQIGTQGIGTGASKRIEFVTTGAVRAGIDTSGHSFITVGRRLYFGGNTSGVYFYQLSNGLEIGGGNIQGSDTQPLLDITGTWNTTGATSGITLDVTDTASASTSTLLDLKVGAASKFKVDKSGFITATRFSTANGYMWFNNNGAYLRISDSYLYSPNTGGNVWEVRNGTNAQEFRIFNTYTNDTNYERAALKWDSNNFTFSTEAAGTGNVRNFNFAGGNVGINTPGTVSYPLQITGRTTDGIVARILHQSPTGGYGLWIESNDQNSGIFQVAFNTIGGPSANLSTNLGTNAYFQVYEGTSTKSLQLGQTFSGGVNLSVKSNLQIGIDSDNDGVGAFEIAKANNYNGRLDSDGIPLFRILNSGNVGIGITNPTYKLVIAQDTNTTASLLQLRNSDATYSQTWDFQSDTAKDLVVTGGSGNGGVVFKPGTRGFSVHNGTNPQKLLVYNTYTNDTNYERGSIEWSSNVFLIEAQYSGTGASRYLRIKAGVNYFELIPSSGQINFSGGTRFKYPSNGTLEVRTSSNVPGDLVAGTYSVYTKSGVGSAVATQAGDSTTLTTTTPTQIASFATTHLGAKLVIQAADTVTGERQMSEILLVHDGTVVTLTEYGIIYTNASLATYTASISGGNVIVNATSASTNSTTYKVMETLI